MKNFILFIFALASFEASSQNLNPGLGYLFNPYELSPAWAGISKPDIQTADNRVKAVRVDLSSYLPYHKLNSRPMGLSGFLDFSVGKDSSAGIGISVQNAQNHILRNTVVKGSYAYQVSFKDNKHSIRAGMSLGWINQGINTSNTNPSNPNDPVLTQGVENANSFLVDCALGYSYYNQKGGIEKADKYFALHFDIKGNNIAPLWLKHGSNNPFYFNNTPSLEYFLQTKWKFNGVFSYSPLFMKVVNPLGGNDNRSSVDYSMLFEFDFKEHIALWLATGFTTDFQFTKNNTYSGFQYPLNLSFGFRVNNAFTFALCYQNSSIQNQNVGDNFGLQFVYNNLK